MRLLEIKNKIAKMEEKVKISSRMQSKKPKKKIEIEFLKELSRKSNIQILEIPEREKS